MVINSASPGSLEQASATSSVTTLEGRQPNLVRSTVHNFLGSLVPLLAGILTIPYTVHHLGVSRFAVLSLAWIVLSYFAMFDFGLGRATAKFVSESLAAREMERIPRLLWTSLWLQCALGVLGALVLCAGTPILVDRLLNIPADLVRESKLAFFLLSAAVPVMIASTAFRSVLEAALRFDLSNALRIPFNSLIFVIPAVGAGLKIGLPSIILLLCLSQAVGMLMYMRFCFRILPILRPVSFLDPSLLRPLLNYGGWVTVYSLLIPPVMYLDRFLIGMFYPIATVSYYTVPYDAVSRVQVLPQSVATTLFPTMSGLGLKRKEEVAIMCARGLKYLLVVMVPTTLTLTLLAPVILHLWLGEEFASRSALTFQLLALGFFVNALAWPPTTVLLGIGRPDLVAKGFAALLLVHALVTAALSLRWGIVGAAAAVVVRSVLQLTIFFTLSWRSAGLRFANFSQNGLVRGGIVSFTLLCVVSLLLVVAHSHTVSPFILIAVLATGFSVVLFAYVLDAEDRWELRTELLHLLSRSK